jgi:N4-gp56 family major capsid protein
MTITDRSVLSPAVREYYDRLLLRVAYPLLQHTKFAQKRILPAKSGDIIVFRRYARLATVPVPLVDGITPPGAPLSTTDIKATIDFYGNFVMVTNQVELTVEDRVLNESSKLLAQNMAQTIDEITRDVLSQTSSVTQCTNGSNANTPTELTKEDIDSVVTTLLGNDALMISEMIKASDGFSTTPIRPAFMGIIDASLIDDLEQVSNFVSSANYGNIGPVLDGEWGSTGNVRWLYTSVGSVSSAATPIYSNFIVGKEAYGVIHLRSESGEFYVKPLGSGGSSDPLNQRASIGWSHPYTCRILNDNFMNNLLATHS